MRRLIMKTLKKTLSVIIAVSITVLALAGCGGSKPEESVEITVFAAASMTETMTAITDKYTADHPGVTIITNFGSSGTLKTQIEGGAECDIFISAAPKQMNELEEEGMINSETRFDLLENKVTLVVPEGNPKNINSFEDLIKGLNEGNILLAIGNEDVPVGQYTLKIFDYFGLDIASLEGAHVISYGKDVKEVTGQVGTASVDCGIIYATDAFSEGLTVVASATPEMCGQVIYPAALLSGSENAEAAKAFLEYLTSDEAAQIFESVGFTVIK